MWYSLQLGDGVAAYAPSRAIQDAWFKGALAAAAAGRTDYSNAVFAKTTFDNAGMMVTLYFTPTAKALAMAYGAVECEKPTMDEIGLEAGDQRAWDIHFPGWQNRNLRPRR